MDAGPAPRTRTTRALLWVGLLVAVSWSGCIGAVDKYYEFDPDPQYVNPGVFVGNYSMSQRSIVLQPGPYVPSAPEVVQLRSLRPAYADAAGALDDAQVTITMAIWRPQCPDLDEQAQAEVDAGNATACPPITGERVPIIIDAGPYFEIGQECEVANQDPCTAGYVNNTIADPDQTTIQSLESFLPHGYAVVQLAVRGTGTSGGCMDLMGDDEVHDLDQALTYLGEQPWSNGRIAMQGVSYDGSTPWNAAATGNPYLKTIVPISGLPDIYDLMFHNGSAETRGAIMHSTQVYWSYGFRDDWLGLPRDTMSNVPVPLPVAPPGQIYNPLNGQANGRQDYQNLQNLLCAEALNGQVTGQASVATGNRLGANPYWVERDHRDDILDNYTGSVFLIHGLQDWNVDPHSAIPFNQALRAKGLEVKEWYGQWDHNTPDGWCGNSVPEWASLPCRLDYAEVLFRWFERHLKDNQTVDTGPAIQVQDNMGQWRNADEFPYTGDQWTRLHLTAEALTEQAGSSEEAVRLMPSLNGAPAQIVQVRSEPLEQDLRISGMPQLDLPFEVVGQGGQIGAWLFDQDPDGNVRAPFVCPGKRAMCPEPYYFPYGTPVVGHAQLNLLYHAGGEELTPIVPGERYTAQVEFEPMEVLIPAGHRMVLWVFQHQYPDHSAATTISPIDVFVGGEGAVLRLPTPEVDQKTVFPVPGSHFPQRDLLPHMYVPMPVFPPSGPVAVAVTPAGSVAPAPATAAPSLPALLTGT